MKKLAALCTVFCLLILSVTACGSATDSTTAETTEAETTAAETTQASETTEAAAETETTTASEGTAADLESLDISQSKYLSDEVLTVGLESTFPPFEYVGDGTELFNVVTSNEGNVTGFDVALMDEIGNRIGVDVEIEDMDFDGLVPAIGSRLDCVASGMTITPERSESVTFSDPYYDATQSVLVAASSDISTRDDLAACGAIGVQSGTTGETIAREINDAAVVSVASFNQAVLDLVNGRSDAVVIDDVPAEAFLAQYPDDLKILPGDQFDFDVEQYGIAMPQDDEILVAAVNAALADMVADGTYDSLVEDYITNYEAES